MEATTTAAHHPEAVAQATAAAVAAAVQAAIAVAAAAVAVVEAAAVAAAEAAAVVVAAEDVKTTDINQKGLSLQAEDSLFL